MSEVYLRNSSRKFGIKIFSQIWKHIFICVFIIFYHTVSIVSEVRWMADCLIFSLAFKFNNDLENIYFIFTKYKLFPCICLHHKNFPKKLLKCVLTFKIDDPLLYCNIFYAQIKSWYLVTNRNDHQNEIVLFI